MMSEEQKKILRASGPKGEELLKIHEINQSGYAGIMPTGMIVDRREHPEALPVQKNTMFGIPEPKELRLLKFFEDDKIVRRPKDIDSKDCDHTIIMKEVKGVKYRFCKHCNMLAHQDGNFSYSCGFDHCRCQN